MAGWTAMSELHHRSWRRREVTFTEQRRLRVRDFVPTLAAAEDAALDEAFEGYLRRYEAAWTCYGDVLAALARLHAPWAEARRADERR